MPRAQTVGSMRWDSRLNSTLSFAEVQIVRLHLFDIMLSPSIVRQLTLLQHVWRPHPIYVSVNRSMWD
jgi:hypothetical protein